MLGLCFCVSHTRTDASLKHAARRRPSRETLAETNSNSVAERINQQKYYVQRGTSAAAESFLRND